jgi:erythritol transport system ATP-binding protein
VTEAHSIGLSIRGGVKVYPGTRALKGVDFDLRMGAVNVLVGENGAGKSTLMKVIAGVETLTEGRIEMGGQVQTFRSKSDAVAKGIGIVFQELNLFPNLTVAENIFIAREPTRFGVDIDARAQSEAARALMKRLEQDIDPDVPLGTLRIGQQQVVEIAKALAQDARILILDEPTSALSATEVEVLFRVIADLRDQGVGIVYISHRLEELIRIGDYITVLRDGVITGAQSMQGVDIPWIVKAMIGEGSKEFPRTEPAHFGAEVFRAEDICLPRLGGGFTVDHVSLAVRSGEILGLYGLMGAGRTEFLECIMAQHPLSTGQFYIMGQPLTERDVTGRIARGLALIAGAADFIKRLTIKVASPDNPVSSLSGGNQQKVVIGKALMTDPKILLMDEPSRGIDIGAKAEVFRTMRKLASAGLGILFVTSDLDEVLALSDRILVMADGRLTGEFDPAAGHAAVISAATRHKTKKAAA